MYQKWTDLLFLHWEYDADYIQSTLPEGLYVDTFDNKAYIGLVPFFMRNIRPRFCPCVPGISNFQEINLRTYVFDKKGRPGVWFYSLDANQWLAVRLGRSFFNLPYHDALMTADKGDSIRYTSQRKNADRTFRTEIDYKYIDKLPEPQPESFEFFLIERYLLFAQSRAGHLFSGQVYHEPYSLCSVEAKIQTTGIPELEGFDVSQRTPDHAIVSPGVQVDIFSIERIL